MENYYRNNWEIIDDNGTIYSGTQNEMEDLFSDIVNGGRAAPLVNWTGDLKLVEIHDVYQNHDIYRLKIK